MQQEVGSFFLKQQQIELSVDERMQMHVVLGLASTIGSMNGPQGSPELDSLHLLECKILLVASIEGIAQQS